MRDPRSMAKIPPPFLPALKKFWAQEEFDPTGRSLLLAVSGGADSVALLELFSREIAPRQKCRLYVIHVNHRLREAAGSDQAFVEKLCRERKIPVHVETLNPSTRPPGQSVEMWGREKRYAAFARIRKAVGADTVLTAHHRDDVVETLCLRLWRGTGLAGLAGIPFRRDEYVRPLLPVPRAELRNWLAKWGISWMEDETNEDLGIPRNWVRRRLLPEWRTSDPGVDRRLFQISRHADSLKPHWEKWMAESFPEEAVREKGGIPVEWFQDELDADSLRRLLPMLGLEKPSPEIMAEILRQAAKPGGSVRIRISPTLVLTEKHGILVLSRGTST